MRTLITAAVQRPAVQRPASRAAQGRPPAALQAEGGVSLRRVGRRPCRPARGAPSAQPAGELPPDSQPASPAQQAEAAPSGGSIAAAQEQQQQQPAAAEAPAAAAGAGLTWRRLVSRTVGTLSTNLWPILLIYLVCDSLVFLLHRASHRLTNEGGRGRGSVGGLEKSGA